MAPQGKRRRRWWWRYTKIQSASLRSTYQIGWVILKTKCWKAFYNCHSSCVSNAACCGYIDTFYENTLEIAVTCQRNYLPCRRCRFPGSGKWHSIWDLIHDIRARAEGLRGMAWVRAQGKRNVTSEVTVNKPGVVSEMNPRHSKVSVGLPMTGIF